MHDNPILVVDSLKKHYAAGFGARRMVKALDDVSFTVDPRQTLGIVGESGCGKSTLAKTLMGLERPTAGEILIYPDGRQAMRPGQVHRRAHSDMQMVFQDPYGSLNPRKTVRDLIAAPLYINAALSKAECRERALEAMEQVGLGVENAERYPHMLSGGQRQRVGIARALVLQPRILICDEPVSALDVSVQARVLNLLMDLQDRLGLTYLFISHDLSVVEHISDKLMVMYLGKIVEYGDREAILSGPLHPYTRALFASAPALAGTLQLGAPAIRGEAQPAAAAGGCAFQPRCPQATADCKTQTPQLKEVAGRFVSCIKFV